jgi:hypothetical protein
MWRGSVESDGIGDGHDELWRIEGAAMPQLYIVV